VSLRDLKKTGGAQAEEEEESDRLPIGVVLKRDCSKGTIVGIINSPIGQVPYLLEAAGSRQLRKIRALGTGRTKG